MEVDRDLSQEKETARQELSKLELWDSFFTTITLNQIGGRYGRVARSMGIKLSTRRVTENGINGIRVWRIE